MTNAQARQWIIDHWCNEEMIFDDTEQDQVVQICLEALSDRPKGTWIKWGSEVKCSECHICNPIDKPFCPNCGAAMRCEKVATCDMNKEEK